MKIQLPNKNEQVLKLKYLFVGSDHLTHIQSELSFAAPPASGVVLSTDGLPEGVVRGFHSWSGGGENADREEAGKCVCVFSWTGSM